MRSLVLLLLAASGLALKTPTLCANGSGNDFVCSVIEPIHEDDSYSQFPSIDAITIGKKGQDDFYKAAQAVEILRSSLRNQTNSEALNDNPYSWFKILADASGQLETAKSGTQKLINSASSGLQNLQTAYLKTTSTNSKKVEKTTAKAIENLAREVDQKAVRYQSEEYSAAVEKCLASVSKQVETLQNRTREDLEKSYGSLIDLADQIGLCIQKDEIEGKCARIAKTKMTTLRSLPRISENNASKFEAIGRRNFEKDTCLKLALKRFDDSVEKILRTAPQKD